MSSQLFAFNLESVCFSFRSSLTQSYIKEKSYSEIKELKKILVKLGLKKIAKKKTSRILRKFYLSRKNEYDYVL